MPVYADNPSNRKLNRVGLEKGSVKAPTETSIVG